MSRITGWFVGADRRHLVIMMATVIFLAGVTSGIVLSWLFSRYSAPRYPDATPPFIIEIRKIAHNQAERDIISEEVLRLLKENRSSILANINEGLEALRARLLERLPQERSDDVNNTFQRLRRRLPLRRGERDDDFDTYPPFPPPPF